MTCKKRKTVVLSIKKKYKPFRISCFRLAQSVKDRERGWGGELGKKWNKGNTLNGSLQSGVFSLLLRLPRKLETVISA